MRGSLSWSVFTWDVLRIDTCGRKGEDAGVGRGRSWVVRLFPKCLQLISWEALDLE